MSLYLSRLVIEPGNRLTRRDLASPYEMHRTIMRAFPSAENGGPGRVLFRLEPGGSADAGHVILVQSDKQPDWQALPDGYLADLRCKQLKLDLPAGCHLRFRLRANPTVRRDGKRHGLLKEDQQIDWLKRKAEQSGFRLLHIVVQGDEVVFSPDLSRRRGAASHLAVTFEGVLQVVDPSQFASAVAAGIGSAKGFGFGLLSLAPVAALAAR